MLGGLDYRPIAALVKRAIATVGVTVGDFTVGGALVFSGTASPAQITAAQNDYTPTGLSSASTLRLSSDARRNLTGLAGGSNGRELVIHNVGTFPITFSQDDAASNAGNRFAFAHTLSGGHSMRIKYDSTSARWRCVFREIPAGTILPFGGGTVPSGFLARDGSNISRTTYAPLFNEVGTTWGVGDGSTTFGVGDDRRRTWVGSGGAGTGTLGNAVGNTGGAETHTLASTEIGDHTHNQRANDAVSGHQITASGPSGGSGYATATQSGAVLTTFGVNGGAGGAHNNVQPSAVVTAIIKY